MYKLIFVANPFRLSPAQLQSVAAICLDAAQVIFGSAVIAPLFTNELNIPVLVLGLTATLTLWYINLVLVRKLEL